MRIADLRFRRVDNRIEAVRVATARPVRDRKRLPRLFCDKIEAVDPGFGVEQMVLTAIFAEPLMWRAQGNDLMTPAAPDVTDLIDTVANRLGRTGRLYRLVPGDSFVPERSVRRVAPTTPASELAWPENWPWPTRLLAHPEPVTAMALLPDQPPTAFTWRGQRRRVLRANGPEWIHGEWWLRPGGLWAARDYFQLSRPRRASASGYSAEAMAHGCLPAISAGGCTGCLDESRSRPSGDTSASKALR